MSPTPALRTCGARIPVNADLRTQAYAARRAAPGLARGSVLCELAEHGRDRHAGIVRTLAHPPGGAVWAAWTAEDEPLCLALDDCGKRGEEQDRPCRLFTGHPGVCAYARQDALLADPARAGRIDAALAILAASDQHDELTVQKAAHDAVLLTWDELRARQIWPGLPESDHAAMHRLVARAESVQAPRTDAAGELGHGVAEMTRLWSPSSPRRLPHGDSAENLLKALDRLPPDWRAVVLGSQRAPQRMRQIAVRAPFDLAVQLAVQQADAGLAPPPAVDSWEEEWDRKEDWKLGARTSERLTRLPYGWQVDAVRRIALGTDALDAVSDAALSINVIRLYGVYLAWNAPHQPRRTPGQQ